MELFSHIIVKTQTKRRKQPIFDLGIILIAIMCEVCF